MSSCSRRVTRVYYAMFFLFWLNLSFLLGILYVIQRDFLDTHRNDDDSFVSLRRSAQYDVSSHNIHMFACFDIRIFYDYIFDIWSINEYDSSIHNYFITFDMYSCNISWCINLFVMSSFVNFNIIDEKFFLWFFFKIHRILFIFKLEWNVAFILFNVLIIFFSHFSLWLRMFFTRISYIITTLIWRFKFVFSQIFFV